MNAIDKKFVKAVITTNSKAANTKKKKGMYEVESTAEGDEVCITIHTEDDSCKIRLKDNHIEMWIDTNNSKSCVTYITLKGLIEYIKECQRINSIEVDDKDDEWHWNTKRPYITTSEGIKFLDEEQTTSEEESSSVITQYREYYELLQALKDQKKEVTSSKEADVDFLKSREVSDIFVSKKSEEKNDDDDEELTSRSNHWSITFPSDMCISERLKIEILSPKITNSLYDSVISKRKGLIDFKDIVVRLAEHANPSILTKFLDWQSQSCENITKDSSHTSTYKKNFVLNLEDEHNNILQKWCLYGCTVSGINIDSLDIEKKYIFSVKGVEMTIVYDFLERIVY